MLPIHNSIEQIWNNRFRIIRWRIKIITHWSAEKETKFKFCNEQNTDQHWRLKFMVGKFEIKHIEKTSFANVEYDFASKIKRVSSI